AFTLCIGHKEDGRFIADVIRGRHPPFDPREVAAEYAELAKEYRIRKVVGGNFAGEWVAGAFEGAGVDYERSELARSGLYLEALPHFAREAVSIPNHSKMIRELKLMERRTSRAGKDSVDHPTNGSDDFANALAGAIWLAMGKRGSTYTLAGVDGPGGPPVRMPHPLFPMRGFW